MSKIFCWLKGCMPCRLAKTYPTLSEPGPHIPVRVESPPIARDLCEDQIDRYEWAYAELSRPKSERMMRQVE